MLIFLVVIAIATQAVVPEIRTKPFRYTRQQDTCNCCMQGPAGTPGVPGTAGLPGRHGNDGERGERGEKGEAGQQGLQGRDGQMGLTGPTGVKGDKGDRGRRGHKGNTGPMGPIGPPGEPGLQGAKGEPAPPPRRIAFTVALKEQFGPVSQNSPLMFNDIKTNIGGFFDKHSSQFVCPINGTYTFFATITGKAGSIMVYIVLNQKHQLPMLSQQIKDEFSTGSNQVVLHLTQGDHVWLELSPGGTLNNDFTSFSGFLLWPDDGNEGKSLNNNEISIKTED